MLLHRINYSPAKGGKEIIFQINSETENFACRTWKTLYCAETVISEHCCVSHFNVYFIGLVNYKLWWVYSTLPFIKISFALCQGTKQSRTVGALRCYLSILPMTSSQWDVNCPCPHHIARTIKLEKMDVCGWRNAPALLYLIFNINRQPLEWTDQDIYLYRGTELIS